MKLAERVVQRLLEAPYASVPPAPPTAPQTQSASTAPVKVDDSGKFTAQAEGIWIRAEYRGRTAVSSSLQARIRGQGIWVFDFYGLTHEKYLEPASYAPAITVLANWVSRRGIRELLYIARPTEVQEQTVVTSVANATRMVVNGWDGQGGKLYALLTSNVK